MSVTKLHEILKEGVEAGASDWHIREGSPISLRIAGDIRTHHMVATRGFLDEILSTVIDKASVETYNNTGDVDFALDEDEIGRFRVNLHRQRGRISMTLRYVKATVPDREELGLPTIIHQLAEAKTGIIFVTGATGSGKSTTLACMIEHINHTLCRHILTVEDPIEYNFLDELCVIEQREVGLDTLSFDTALRNAMRQDPDIIVVGELRSRESFDSALLAAETGHLVMTTLHTTNAALSIGRILDFYPHEERESIRKNLASNLRGIICQRLIPRISGVGMVPINEILINTPIVSKLIDEGRINVLDSAIAGGENEGMQTFNNALLALIKGGIISEEEAYKFSSNPESLKMNLNGIFLNEAAGIIK